MNTQRYFLLQLCLLLLISVEECGSKRGGILTGGRGSSASRSAGLFGGSRSAGARTSGGGLFGGSRTSGGIFGSSKTGSGYPGGYSRGIPPSGGGWGTRSRGGIGGTGGGWGGSRGSWGRPRGGGLFTKSNIGSFVAGAAAGYLTYKAGRALIRSAYAPMMWHNRPYYWGSNYYRGGYGTHMCRMPVDHDDAQLGNVYFQDGTRPKELVWSCNYNEYCCGYDCCWRGGASSYWGFGLGSILVMLLGLCCVLTICTRIFSMRPGVQQYMPGRLRKFVIPVRRRGDYTSGQQQQQQQQRRQLQPEAPPYGI